MLDVKECCRLCIKPKQQSMKDCADDPIAVTVQDCFGIELVVNGPLSTKICRDCIFKVLDYNLYKTTVINNQASLEQYRVLQESLRLSPSQVKQEDDDDVILVRYDAPTSSTNNSTHDLSEDITIPSSEPIETVEPVETVERVETVETEETAERVETVKSVEKVAEKRPPTTEPTESPDPKNIKLKKLKIICTPINAQDISQFILREKDKRILKLNAKKQHEQKNIQIKETPKKRCESAAPPYQTKKLMVGATSDSEDEDKDDGAIMTLKDYLDKYNKNTVESSESVAGTNSTSKLSASQKVGKLSIPPPPLVPTTKSGNKSPKQYTSKRLSNKRNIATPILKPISKSDYMHIASQIKNQPKSVNQSKSANQSKSTNEPESANQPKLINQTKPANQPKPATQPKPVNQLKSVNQLNKSANQSKQVNQPKVSPKPVQSGVFYTNITASPAKTNTQPSSTGLQITAVKCLEQSPKVIVPTIASVPTPLPIVPIPTNVPTLTIPKNAEPGKVSKLIIYGGKIFNEQGSCLGAVGNSLKNIQAMAGASGNTFTFKVSQTEAQKWQAAIIEKRIAPIPGSATTVPIANTTISAIPGPPIPSVPGTAIPLVPAPAIPSVPSTTKPSSSSTNGPFPVKLIPAQQSNMPSVIQEPKIKPIDSPRLLSSSVSPATPVTPANSANPTNLPDVGFVDSAVDTRVKVLSVNELNNRASDGSPDTRKLPIRITLVKIKNEVQIKLTDSKNNEIHYSDLTAQEQVAVKTSLLQPSSRAQIISAIKSCKPDQYSEQMLQAFGISATDLA